MSQYSRDVITLFKTDKAQIRNMPIHNKYNLTSILYVENYKAYYGSFDDIFNGGIVSIV